MNLIEEKIQSHYDYYLTVGVETAQQQAGNLQQVSADYQGRVLYELLQNAFDKSEGKILVELKDNTLYIANDGAKFTYNAGFNYKNGKSTRCDFESLCSISTSTKTDATSIGNKGVGFKSVFSVSAEGYVKIHSKGKIHKEEEFREENISFLMYDVFTENSTIHPAYPETIKEYLKENISAVQSERAERGIPGYYFPLLLNEENPTINGLFEEGYVTVIEIPFEDEELIQNLIKEIEAIHFKFVSLKHKNKFNLLFRSPTINFEKTVSQQEKGLISTELKKEKLEELAKAAGVTISNKNYVGIYFREDNNGLIYNYLPTQNPSPFPYVDFHADFHTTVDRRSIDFSSQTTIGRYNTLLLEACIELLFVVLYKQVDKLKVEDLDIQIINHSSISGSHPQIDWNFLSIGNAKICKEKIRKLFRVDDALNQWNHNDNKRYRLLTSFLSKKAKEYFDKGQDEVKYTEFYARIVKFISQLTDDYNKNYSRSETFKSELAFYFKKDEVKILPSIDFKDDDEIFFKQNELEEIQIPNFLGVKVTNFEVEDKQLRSRLGIKEYSDSYPILRYFRQVSIHGKYSETSISEHEQKELLHSLFNFFKNRHNINSFAHRYERFINAKIRADSSAQNNANFSVSTVFLKLTTGKYKPALLCSTSEIDKSFFSNIEEKELTSFLQFLGVSSIESYLVVDKSIYDKLKDGIDYIPMTLGRDTVDSLTGDKILPEIRVIYKNKEIHPALINYNRYPFLYDITNRKVREQLTPLRIGKYNEFPSSYTDVLINKLENAIQKHPEHVIRLYSHNLFNLLHRKNKYVVSNNGEYQITSNTDFLIVSNKEEYDLLSLKSINLLCHYNANEIDDPKLNKKKIKLTLSEVKTEGKKEIKTETFKKKLYPLIPFLLIEISKLDYSISERDYLHSSTDIERFKEQFNRIEINEYDKVTAIWSHSEENIVIEQREPFQWFPNENIIYLERNISDREYAKLIAKHIFNLSMLSDKIELLLSKDIDEVIKEYDRLDVEHINKFFIPDYLDKFKAFQKEILSSFTEFSSSPSQQWYLYNSHFQSEFLIKLSQKNLIPKLEEQIKKAKEKEEYRDLFKDFNLQISRSHIERKVSKLKTILNLNSSNQFMVELENLVSQLGVEERLLEIEQELKQLFPNAHEDTGFEEHSSKEEEKLSFKNKVNTIYQKILVDNKKEVSQLNLSGDNLSQNQLSQRKRVIYTGNHKLATETELAAIGASGEEEVLIYFISVFLGIKSIEEREKGINAVYELIKDVVPNYQTFEVLRDDCLSCINEDEELRRALIPFFYITMHYKFSNFDLLAYDNGKAVMVEVKTTNKKCFIMSISEVLRAREGDNYIIVRVASDRLEIIGNPIKQFESHIKEIKTDKIALKPRNYEVTIL